MDIKKIVTDYIKAENTDYAIMVTGVWGSGKNLKYRAKVRTKSQSENTGFTDGLRSDDMFFLISFLS